MQRSGPGAGTARTWTVSSTVGTQPASRSRLNTAGGNASATSSSASVSIGRPSANANQPATSRRRRTLAAGRRTPMSSGRRRTSSWSIERRRHRAGCCVPRDALLDRRQVRRTARHVRRARIVGSGQVAEGADELEDASLAGAQSTRHRREPLALLHDLACDRDVARLAGREVVGGDRDRVRDAPATASQPVGRRARAGSRRWRCR